MQSCRHQLPRLIRTQGALEIRWTEKILPESHCRFPPVLWLHTLSAAICVNNLFLPTSPSLPAPPLPGSRLSGVINSQATAQRAPTPGNNHAKITVRHCRASVLDINFPQFDRLPPPAVRLMGLFFSTGDGCFPASLFWAVIGYISVPSRWQKRALTKEPLLKPASALFSFFIPVIRVIWLLIPHWFLHGTCDYCYFRVPTQKGV